jgi:hypothetical protein
LPELIDLGIDFETYYTQQYSLSVLTTPEYILHPDFEVIGVSLAPRRGAPAWYSGDRDYLQRLFNTIDWAKTRVIAHNCMFDGAILEWIFGCQPAQYLCTMMGSRPHVVPFAGGQSLEKVSKYLNLGVKGKAVHKFKGMRRLDFDQYQLREYGSYCTNDTVLSCKIAEYLDPILPDEEKQILDSTIKKFTRPQLYLNAATLAHYGTKIELERQTVITDLIGRGLGQTYDGVVDMLRSRTGFAKTLKDHGAPPPMKKNKDGEDTFAFAKNDLDFIELRTHPNSDIRALVEAKLMFASNQEISRTKRLLGVARASDPPLLPVPLKYYGAHTGRFSGADSVNLQNLNRVDPDNPDSAFLRRAIVAPPGYKIVAADLSNIEARIVATLAGQWELVDQFKRSLDPYSIFATKIYGRTVTKKDKTERFVGKTCILGLGYGMGAQKFFYQMQLAKVPMKFEQAKKIVYMYRDVFSKIPKLWGVLEEAVKNACPHKGGIFTYECLQFLHERITLPNGMPIMYPGIRVDRFGKLVFDGRYGKKKKDEEDGDLMTTLDDGMGLWGGTITENVVQALARIILTRAESRLERAGLRAALQVHDELVYCVPERHVDAVKRACEMAMTAPVDWMPMLPVAVEIGVGDTYWECK